MYFKAAGLKITTSKEYHFATAAWNCQLSSHV